MSAAGRKEAGVRFNVKSKRASRRSLTKADGVARKNMVIASDLIPIVRSLENPNLLSPNKQHSSQSSLSNTSGAKLKLDTASLTAQKSKKHRSST